MLWMIGLSAWTLQAGDVAAQDAGDSAEKPLVRIETSMGDIVVELEADRVPITVDNFLQYAREGYYDGTIFHRLVKEYVVQGGGWTPQMFQKTMGLREPIFNEWRTGLKNTPGTIAMARERAKPDTAYSEFFFNLNANTHHDTDEHDGAGYCAFGRVVQGWEVVDTITHIEVVGHPNYGNGKWIEVPRDIVTIRSVRLINEFDEEALAKRAKAELLRHEMMAKQEQDAIKARVDEVVSKYETMLNLPVTRTESGLAYFDITAGQGEAIESTDKVGLHYMATLPDGTEIANSFKKGEALRFDLQGVYLRGWIEGVRSMRVGGLRLMILPPDLAFGKAGKKPDVPPDAIIIIKTEVLTKLDALGNPTSPGVTAETKNPLDGPDLDGQ